MERNLRGQLMHIQSYGEKPEGGRLNPPPPLGIRRVKTNIRAGKNHFTEQVMVNCEVGPRCLS